MKKILLTTAAAYALFIAGTAQAQTTIGANNGGNCYPFSCGPTDSLTQYQQGYRAGAFSGPLTFNTLSYNQYGGFQPGPNLDQGTYSVSFYYSANAFNALNSTLSSNLGTFIGNFGSFSLNGAAPALLSLTGSTINYDPTLGDLLMNVVISGGSSYNGNYNYFYAADYNGADTTRAWNSTTNGNFSSTTGALATTFSVASGVPEPATWAMMIMGFGAIGFAMRRRNAVQTKVRYA